MDAVNAQWYVAQTQWRAEDKAVRYLESQGFTTFLPKYRRRLTEKGVPLRQETPWPLFPGYLFVAFDAAMAQWRRINGTPGVRGLICDAAAERPLPIPGKVIADLRARMGRDGLVELFDGRGEPLYRRGQRLRITKGPFRDFEGIYAGTSLERVAILLDIMHGQVEVSVPSQDVAAAG